MKDDEHGHTASQSGTQSRGGIELSYDETGVIIRLPWKTADGLLTGGSLVHSRLVARAHERVALQEQARHSRLHDRRREFFHMARCAARHIRKMKAEGVSRSDSVADLASILHMRPSDLEGAIKRHNGKLKKRHQRKRRYLASKWRAEGLSNREIGERLGVSGQRIGQWLSDIVPPAANDNQARFSRMGMDR